MRKMRLELTRDYSHKNLNLARLPIPTLPQNTKLFKIKTPLRLSGVHSAVGGT